MKMYEKKCPLCGNRLDPEEKCKCQIINKMKEYKESGKRINIELNRVDFLNAKVKKVTEQEIIIEDSTGKSWDIDMDSVVGIN